MCFHTVGVTCNFHVVLVRGFESGLAHEGGEHFPGKLERRWLEIGGTARVAVADGAAARGEKALRAAPGAPQAELLPFDTRAPLSSPPRPSTRATFTFLSAFYPSAARTSVHLTDTLSDRVRVRRPCCAVKRPRVRAPSFSASSSPAEALIFVNRRACSRTRTL